MPETGLPIGRPVLGYWCYAIKKKKKGKKKKKATNRDTSALDGNSWALL